MIPNHQKNQKESMERLDEKLRKVLNGYNKNVRSLPDKNFQKIISINRFEITNQIRKTPKTNKTEIERLGIDQNLKIY